MAYNGYDDFDDLDFKVFKGRENYDHKINNNERQLKAAELRLPYQNQNSYSNTNQDMQPVYAEVSKEKKLHDRKLRLMRENLEQENEAFYEESQLYHDQTNILRHEVNINPDQMRYQTLNEDNGFNSDYLYDQIYVRNDSPITYYANNNGTNQDNKSYPITYFPSQIRSNLHPETHHSQSNKSSSYQFYETHENSKAAPNLHNRYSECNISNLQTEQRYIDNNKHSNRFRNKRHEKIRSFPKPSKNAPAIPLPDYDIEATVEYVPEPDY